MAIEELAEEVVNEVANNFEEAAEAARKINTVGLSYLVVGVGIGAAVGFYFGYKFSREKIRAEAYREAEAEIDVIRKVYLEKMNETKDDGLQGSVTTEKPPIEEVVERLGYQTPVPSHEKALTAPPIPMRLPPPVPIMDDLLEDPVDTSKPMNAGWNYERELANRTPDSPYIIHQNEYNHSNLNYTKVVYTYYADDDYLVDPEIGRPVMNGDVIVGVDNLKFGHGSDDSDVVYVRNDIQEMDMEICRVHRSYEEEELGLHHSPDDDDDDDDDN